MTGERNDEIVGDSPVERALKDDFGALRASVEASAVPDFTAMIEHARAEAASTPALTVSSGEGVSRSGIVPRSWIGRAGWASMAAAAAIASLMFVTAQPDGADAEFERLVASYSADAGLGAWSSPTDALLRTPGIDLGAVPSVRPAFVPRDDSSSEGRDS
jgi:hypothetical protein